jgi:hypothetical protein
MGNHDVSRVKMIKCKIFDLSDSCYFYTTKSTGTEIKNNLSFIIGFISWRKVPHAELQDILLGSNSQT